MTNPTPIDEVIAVLGETAVTRDRAALTAAARPHAESPGGAPEALLRVSNLHDLRSVVGIAARAKIPVIPRIAGTNLRFPERGGWIVDLASMNRIVDLDERNQVVVLEPGVTFRQIGEVLDQRRSGLTIGEPLGTADSSVVATCLLDGLGSLSLRRGSMGQWLTGLEVVRADGTLLRTGAWAAGAPPFARAPLPDLTGLFVSMQGATGLVSKAAVRVWPQFAHHERWFLLFFDRRDALRALGDLPRLDVVEDAGAMFWPALKIMLGVDDPRERDPAEPEAIAYCDLGAADQGLVVAKRAVLDKHLAKLARGGARFEGPFSAEDFAKLDPRIARFARAPTRLEFLLEREHAVTWMSSYGPAEAVSPACDAATAVLADHGFPPLVIARPMRGGFAQLRFVEIYDATREAERARALACNQQLCDVLRDRGFVMYRMPAWAVERYRDHLDPGFVRLLAEVKHLLDPDDIMNPGRWSI